MRVLRGGCALDLKHVNEMTVTLELPPDVEARLVEEAQAKGVPVDEIVRLYLLQVARRRAPKQFSAEEIDRLLDEAADLIPPRIPPLSDEAISRESIYTREDEW